jgi:C-terminal peptidase prc
VLVNGESASASEIFAAAMQEHGRGVLVGSPTYGKGTVQTPFPLADGSRLKITTAMYTTPQGNSVDRKGLQPFLRIDLTAAEAAAVFRGDPGARDLPLEGASEILRAALEKRPSVASSRILKQPS